MILKETLPYNIAIKKEDYKIIFDNLLNKKIFCLESFTSFVERHSHKDIISKYETFECFYSDPKFLLFELIKEIVRNHLTIKGTIILDVYKALSLKNKGIKNELFSNYKNNTYYTTYFNSIVGRIYSNYQSWNKVENHHMLHYLSKERLISLDVSSCTVTIYLNIMKQYEEGIEDLLKNFYEDKIDLYLYFFIRTILTNFIEDKSYNENNIYTYFLERKSIFYELVKLTDSDKIEITKENVLNVVRFVSKKLLIAAIYQGGNNYLFDICKIFSIRKNIIENRIINSPFKIGIWNRIIFNLGKNLKALTINEPLYGLPIPYLPNYFKDTPKLSAYILENLASYSIFNSIFKVILKNIPIRGYFFDEILIPFDRLNNIETIKDCFLNNNLIPLKTKVKY